MDLADIIRVRDKIELYLQVASTISGTEAEVAIPTGGGDVNYMVGIS